MSIVYIRSVASRVLQCTCNFRRRLNIGDSNIQIHSERLRNARVHTASVLAQFAALFALPWLPRLILRARAREILYNRARVACGRKHVTNSTAGM